MSRIEGFSRTKCTTQQFVAVSRFLGSRGSTAYLSESKPRSEPPPFHPPVYHHYHHHATTTTTTTTSATPPPTESTTAASFTICFLLSLYLSSLCPRVRFYSLSLEPSAVRHGFMLQLPLAAPCVLAKFFYCSSHSPRLEMHLHNLADLHSAPTLPTAPRPPSIIRFNYSKFMRNKIICTWWKRVYEKFQHSE